MHAPLFLLIAEYPPERMPLGYLVFFGILGLGMFGLSLAANWRLYQKAHKPGWASLVPAYNTFVFLDLIDRSRWWFLLFCIPLLNVVFFTIVAVDLAHAFGKGGGFAIGLVFLNAVFVALLAFGDAQYLYGPAPP